eukprot:3022888-Amphidinium_carterae.1
MSNAVLIRSTNKSVRLYFTSHRNLAIKPIKQKSENAIVVACGMQWIAWETATTRLLSAALASLPEARLEIAPNMSSP